jgi:hypothetical protein
LENKNGTKPGKPGVFRFGTWNIRSLYKPGALKCITSIVKKYYVDLVALQEVRWPGSGHLKSDNMTIFYSGSGNGKHEHGVGFIVKEFLVKLVKKFEAVDDRLCYIIIEGKTSNIAIINCYAPTETADNDYKDSFYDNLERVYDMIPRSYIRILVGNQNAQVRREHAFRHTIGKESMHSESNNNRLRLISFASTKGLVISSTQFQRKEIYKQTWVSPDGRTKSQIDHILIDKRYRSSVRQVRSYRRADGDTDHYLVISSFRTKLANSWKQKKLKGRTRLEIENTKDREKVKSYRGILNNELMKTLQNTEQNLEETWNIVKDSINKSAEVFKKENTFNGKNSWFNERCKEAIENTSGT